MKKNFFYIAALAVITAACTNDSLVTVPVNNGTDEGKMITETITATNGDAPTRAAIADADGAFTWSAGDQVAVHASDGEYHTATLTSGEGTNDAKFTVTYSGTRDAFAVFPASIVSASAANYGQSGASLDVTLPSSYTLDQVSGTTTPCPMIATNTGDSWSFSQLCGLLRLTINQIPADATGLTLDFHGHKVHGDFSIASSVNPGTSTITTTADNTNDKITITDIGDVTSAIINIPLPTGDYTDISITPVGSSTKVSATRHIHRTAGIYNAQRAHAKALTTALVSFQVGASSYAIFAPGNLQATTADLGSNWTWSFANRQYDFVGNATANNKVNGNGTVSANGSVDLFGWSTSATYFGISNAEPFDAYPGDFIDWGINIIGTYEANEWRTPIGGDGSEWTYLISTRANHDAKWGYATVAGVKGLIILPDNFTDPNKNGDSGAFVGNTTSWTSNVYTSGANWNAMEDAGAIFLPAAGYRTNNSVGNVDGHGSYLTSTAQTSQIIYRLELYGIDFESFRPNNTAWRRDGQSVRLLRIL